MTGALTENALITAENEIYLCVDFFNIFKKKIRQFYRKFMQNSRNRSSLSSTAELRN